MGLENGYGCRRCIHPMVIAGVCIGKEKEMGKQFFVLAVVLFLMAISGISSGAQLELVLVAPQGEVRAGQSLPLTLYYNNPGDSPVQAAVFKTVSLQVSSGNKTVEIMAEPDPMPPEPNVTIQGNGFRKVRSLIFRSTVSTKARNCPSVR